MIDKTELETFLREQEEEAMRVSGQHTAAAREVREFCAARRIQDGLFPQAAILSDSMAAGYRGRVEFIRDLRRRFGLPPGEEKTNPRS